MHLLYIVFFEAVSMPAPAGNASGYARKDGTTRKKFLSAYVEMQYLVSVSRIPVSYKQVCTQDSYALCTQRNWRASCFFHEPPFAFRDARTLLVMYYVFRTVPLDDSSPFALFAGSSALYNLLFSALPCGGCLYCRFAPAPASS